MGNAAPLLYSSLAENCYSITSNEAPTLINPAQTLASEYQNLLTLNLNSPQPFRFLVLNRHTLDDACLTQAIA